jgi:RNA polymerase-binding transcription factor DksA
MAKEDNVFALTLFLREKKCYPRILSKSRVRENAFGICNHSKKSRETANKTAN